MKQSLTRTGQSRRHFLNTLLLAQAGLTFLPQAACAAEEQAFSFVLLGDLHFDKLEHHDMEWLRKDKPDDVRQVQDYSRITREVMPRLFDSVKATIAELKKSGQAPPAFVLQIGDLVEGLCGSEALAAQQNTEAIEFLRQANLGLPFLFTKGNHDVTGPGAVEAFRSVFHPFLKEQTASLAAKDCRHDSARYTLEHGGSQFCFFDAYDKESLAWLEAALERRTARHCFVVIHPPVVPYGARSLWHLFAREQEHAAREQLLRLLGKHQAFVLSGHIHKYNLLTRTTPQGGRFVQLALSSVISNPQVAPRNLLTGKASYTADQVLVEPDFSPANQKERRAMYVAEGPFVREFQYADLPGYALVTVKGERVTAQVFSGVSREVWRTIELDKVLVS